LTRNHFSAIAKAHRIWHRKAAMKKLFTLSVLLVASSRAALPQPDLIAQIHFAGPQKITADTAAK
jgi:hypothetical protein